MFRHRVLAGSVVSVALVAGVSLAAVLPDPPVQDAAEGAARAAPSPEIAVVARQVGTWQVDATFMDMPPDKGTSAIRLVGGRWAVEDYKGTFGGEPYEGAGIWGWDSEKRKFVGVWAGTGETKLALSHGTWDEATQTLTNEVQDMDLGAGPTPVIGKLSYVDADHMVFTMHRAEAAEGAAPVMKLAYTREP
jgi:hypothetical protein